MHKGVKEEPPLEMSFQDVGELSKPGPSRFRKRRLSAGKRPGLRLPDITESSIEDMNNLLKDWGLEALSERFAEHMIDQNALDYMLDVDIVDLCRDFPIRYRLVLRHNLQNKYHNNIVIKDQSNKKRPQTIITFSKDPNAYSYESPDRKKKKKKQSVEAPMEYDAFGNDTDPGHFVTLETTADDHDAYSGAESGKEEESIRSVLLQHPQFRKVLDYLDQGLVPDTSGLRFMNRLLVNHFFEERILKARYPKKQEKHDLALKILEAFPQLEKTRVTPEAPPESFFFWESGGKEKGPHTGTIETRTSNMRKEVPPEQRRYLRKEKGAAVNYILPDSIREHATKVADLPPVPSNEQTISNGMAECIDLHSCILQQSPDSDQTEALVSTFPHLLSYGGRMIQEVFERLHTFYEADARMDKFLLLGLLLDPKAFQIVENKYIRGTLRIIKRLIMRGKAEDTEEMSTEEADASPLIRWIKPQPGELEVQAVQDHVSTRSYLAPHIVCLADVFREGNMFIIFQGKYIACGRSAAHTLDVFFKLFAVFGIPVPLLLKKIHELLMVYLWKVTDTCKSVTVTKLVTKMRELEIDNDEDDYEDEDDLS